MSHLIGELTFLSIILAITGLVKSQHLVEYRPTIQRPSHPQGARSLFLTPDAYLWCCPPDAHPDPRIKDDTLVQLGDQLNAFVRGEFMDYADGIDIKRLDPDTLDVWEIRSHLKKPQLRLFGFFAAPKWFVGTNCAVRDDLEPQRGPKWDAAIKKAADTRTDLVGSVGFFSDDRGEYVRNPK